MNIFDCTPEEWIKNEADYLKQLENGNNWNTIPFLNTTALHNLKDSRLVRFRGMIQDSHGLEFYLDKYEVVNETTKEKMVKNGKYLDIINCVPEETADLECPTTVRGDRHTFVAISVPALNHWVRNLEEESFKSKHVSEEPTSLSTTKRALEEEEEKMDVDSNTTVNDSTPKKLCTNEAQPCSSSTTITKDFYLNLPIPDETARICHIKAYGDPESLKLNSVFDFIGFLSVAPLMDSSGENELQDKEEYLCRNPPPSLVPRIHCVFIKNLVHCNPLLDMKFSFQNQMEFVKKSLLIVLTQLLCGDELAAEYLIYHFISKVYLRRDLLALGKYSLNISNVPKLENIDYVNEIYKFIELLTTKSHYFAMSLEKMNQLALIPKKNYDSNILKSSLLQLSPNTHLILDETKLEPGKLNENGIRSLKQFNNIISKQKVQYDFVYYELEFECDIPVLIFSEGKSLLPTDCHVILNPDQEHVSTFKEIIEAAKHYLKPDLLTEIRAYITTARNGNYEISNEVQEMVQSDFVNMRQQANITADDLHNLLVLARLICISLGKTILDQECWKRACFLENARKDRLKPVNEN